MNHLLNISLLRLNSSLNHSKFLRVNHWLDFSDSLFDVKSRSGRPKYYFWIRWARWAILDGIVSRVCQHLVCIDQYGGCCWSISCKFNMHNIISTNIILNINKTYKYYPKISQIISKNAKNAGEKMNFSLFLFFSSPLFIILFIALRASLSALYRLSSHVSKCIFINGALWNWAPSYFLTYLGLITHFLIWLSRVLTPNNLANIFFMMF